MIHPPHTELALGDYYFSLTKQRTCPRTMREVIPVDSCNPVPTWSTFLCNSCSRPVKCQCVAFLAYLKSRHVVRVTQKVCVITSLEREIRKNLYQVFVWRSFVFQVGLYSRDRVLSTREIVSHGMELLYMYPKHHSKNMFSDRNQRAYCYFCGRWQMSFTIVMNYSIFALSEVDQDNMKLVINTITNMYTCKNHLL